MSDPRTEHAAREAEVWTEFEQALSAIEPERWEEEGVLPGWTVKDLVWHVAGWVQECAGHLEEMRRGTFEEPEDNDELTDARNAAFAEAARRMDVTEVRDGLARVRALARERWEALPVVDDAAIEWFEGETYEHYEEHLPDLRRFAGRS